jgi:hypothetical protein
VVQLDGEGSRPEAVIGNVWGRNAGASGLEYALLTEGGVSTLEGLYMLNQVLGPVTWRELLCPKGPEIVADLAELVRDVRMSDLAASFYGERGGELWPRLIGYLGENHDSLAVRLPSPMLIMGANPPWLDVQWEGGERWNEVHPPVLLAMLWTALIDRLGAGDHPTVLVPLEGPAEITLMTREIRSEDVRLFAEDAAADGVVDLRSSVPDGLAKVGHEAGSLEAKLAEVLAT